MQTIRVCTDTAVAVFRKKRKDQVSPSSAELSNANS